MIPSTTCRWSRKGLPRLPSEDGINGEIRAHCASVKARVRDMAPTITDNHAQLMETRPSLDVSSGLVIGEGCGRGQGRGCGQGGPPALASPVLLVLVVGSVIEAQAVRMVCQPVSIRWFQGQSRGRRRRLRRWLLMMRPAMARMRKRSRLGSHRRAGSFSSKARVWVGP